jgi:hypothetical protein
MNVDNEKDMSGHSVREFERENMSNYRVQRNFLLLVLGHRMHSVAQ